MADCILQVPLVGQKVAYDGRPLMQSNAHGQLVQHGFMACWYASACMVSYYWRPGPRLGLLESGSGPHDYGDRPVGQSRRIESRGGAPSGLSPDTIASLLKTHGPIWAAGYFLDGYPQAGDAIVLTGVKGPFVLYNDPWEPKAKQRAWQWVSDRLLNLPNALLAKDPRRS